jgi:hypothetical protein
MSTPSNSPSGTVDPKKEEDKSGGISIIAYVIIGIIVFSILYLVFIYFFGEKSSNNSRFSGYEALYEDPNKFSLHDYDREGPDYNTEGSNHDSRFSGYEALYEDPNKFSLHDYDREGGGYYMYYPYL